MDPLALTATATTTPTPESASRGSRRSRKSQRKQRRLINQMTVGISVLSAVAAAFAPASLTGQAEVDVVERMIFAGLVSYITAHGRRWTWIAGAAVILAPARGPSMFMVVAATVTATWATTRRSRPKHVGAAVGGLLANACLWYTDEAFAIGLIVLCGLVGTAILVVSGFKTMRAKSRQPVGYLLLAVLAVAVVGILGAVAGGLLTASDLTSGTNDARKALRSIENGDTQSARLSLESSKQHLDRAHTILGPATLVSRLVPSLSQHVNALNVSLTESRSITHAADELLASADYDELRYNGRVDVDQIAELAPGATMVYDVLTQAEARLSVAKKPWLASPLASRVEELYTEVGEVREASELASQALSAAPRLFGADGDRRYLVVFLTPAELRGAGGFIGSYAELLARDGRVSLSRSGKIRDLISYGEFGERTLSGPVDYVRRYGRFSPSDYIQDVTYSPHFPYNADVLAQLYPQAGGSPVDGVIGIDPTGLAALLELTGPVEIEGRDEPLTAENAVDFLTRDQYVEFSNYGNVDGTGETKLRLNDERKDFLAEATRATFEELTRASLPSPAAIGAALGPAARGRHIQVWSQSPSEQRLFERLGADSSLDIPDGSDGFEVVQHNAGNNKIDAYLNRRIQYVAEVDPATGAVEAKLRVTISNDVPSIHLPTYVTGNRAGLAKGTSITWLSLFTHHRVVRATVDGEEISISREREAGLNAFDTPFIYVPPNERVTVEFDIEGGVDLSNGYELVIMPQPVANPDFVDVEVRPRSGSFTGPGTADGAVVYMDPMTEPITASALVGAT